jgi:predicted MPP superfamily phosphohydrolase
MALPNGLSRLRSVLVRSFFVHFFRLLLIAVSIAEWGMLWWLLPASVGALPPLGQVAGAFALWTINRWLATHTQRQRHGRYPAGALPRLYYAVAFTSLFCFAFLVATGTLWVLAKVFVGAIVVEARPTAAAMTIGSSVDAAFRWFANAGIGVIVVSFVYGYTVGQHRLRVTRLRLPLRNADAALAGLRIAQISDLHIGQNLGRAQLRRFVERVNALRPDLVCITGDIADGPASDLATFLPVLAGLRARHGVFAILGNHDHYARADWVAERLRALTPIAVLRDAHAVLPINGQRLHLVGLDDRGRDWARGVGEVPRLDALLRDIPPTEPVLLLCHRPDVFPQAATRGVALMLSGHTHGGQLGVPWFNGKVRNLAEFITAFDRGLFDQDGSYLYVNSGLGVTGQRIRLCTPREITLIEIERGPRPPTQLQTRGRNSLLLPKEGATP